MLREWNLALNPDLWYRIRQALPLAQNPGQRVFSWDTDMPNYKLSRGSLCSGGGHCDLHIEIEGLRTDTVPIHLSDGESVTDEEYAEAVKTVVLYELVRSGTYPERYANLDDKTIDTTPTTRR